MRSEFNLKKTLNLKKKLQLTILLTTVPLMLLSIFLLYQMRTYSSDYNKIVKNITAANQINIDFKKKIDDKMYYIIIGNTSFEEEKPYDDLDMAFKITDTLTKNTSVHENVRRLKSIQRNIKVLRKHIGRVEENLVSESVIYPGERISHDIAHSNIENGVLEEPSVTDANLSIFENDIQILSTLIKEGIQEYIYYESQAMETVRANIDQNSQTTIRISIIAFAIIVLFAFMAILAITESIAKPVRHLCDITNQVAKGNLDARVEKVENTTEEIGILNESLNYMIEKIGSLITDVKTEQLNLRVTELKLLQAQINPHFLYNTLDTIIWLAESGDKQAVVDMVSALSNFFRTSLSNGQDRVTLESEEMHIRSYLQIQQVRYQDILEYEIDIPEELRHYDMLKLTLQPIVENALYHGIKNKRGKGRITIRASYEKEQIIIRIQDNGIGMQEEELLRLRASMMKQPSNDSNMGIGLFNVNERIRLNYGAQYGLKIDSTYQRGTEVTIYLPAALS